MEYDSRPASFTSPFRGFLFLLGFKKAEKKGETAEELHMAGIRKSCHGDPKKVGAELAREELGKELHRGLDIRKMKVTPEELAAFKEAIKDRKVKKDSVRLTD